MRRLDRILIALIPALALASAAPVGPSAAAGDTAETNRGWLGVRTDNLSEPMLVALDIDHGVLVTEVVDESPAAKAGVEVGDVILSLEGQKTTDGSTLRRLVRERPEEEVELTIRRRGKEQKLGVGLGTRKLVEHTFSFEWPAIPREALREARRALRDLGPELKKGLDHYDGTMDSLRRQMDALRRELDDLRKELKKD
jgi:hypothetical protein